MCDACDAVLTRDSERRAVEVEHHAAAHLVAAPDLADRARARDAVGLRQHVFHHLAELCRAGVARRRLDLLQEAVPLDAGRIRRLRADIDLAVRLGRDHGRVVQLLYAVLARNLSQRPGDVECREVVGRLVICGDRLHGQLLHLQTVVRNAVQVLLAGFRAARLKDLAKNVRRRLAQPYLRDLGRQRADRARGNARLAAHLPDGLVRGHVRDLQNDLAFVQIPAAVVGGN